jgi:hypothetical protein
MRTIRAITCTGIAALFAASAGAQSNGDKKPATTEKPVVATDSVAAPAPSAISLFRSIDIQHVRPADQRGINVFEWPKNDAVQFKGFALSIGGAFLQDFQSLTHENTATPKVTAGVDANQLMAISPGFSNSVANLFVNAQLARGIRVSMTSYLSARHHNETWVKDGYLLVDASPINVPVLNALMDYMTLRFGQFEVNYGDQHFRRTDNGNSIDNPFVGNLILDAMTTETGAEVYFRSHGLLAMAGITGGESRGMVTSPTKRSAAYLAKLGVDRKLGNDLRVRLTGSMYTIAKASNNVLYSGDRGGSRYYDVMENTASSETANAWSGNIQPGFGHNVQAFVVNPFIKYRGLELFGNFEAASGHQWTESTDRTWRQNAYEAVYRLGSGERFYLGGRYNKATGQLQGIANDVSADRVQLGGGWFVTPNVLFKVENVTQRYYNFPLTDLRSGGRFKGLMIEGVVAF